MSHGVALLSVSLSLLLPSAAYAHSDASTTAPQLLTSAQTPAEAFAPTIPTSSAPGVPVTSLADRGRLAATAVGRLQGGLAKANRKRNALIGMAIGLAAGTAYIVVDCRDSSERNDCRRAGFLVIAPLFAAGGAVTGALVSHAPAVGYVPILRTGRLRIGSLIGGRQKQIVLGVGF